MCAVWRHGMGTRDLTAGTRASLYTRVDTCDLCRHITEQYDERPHPELLPLVVELLLLPLQVTVATCVYTCLYTCVLQREFLRG